MGMGMLALEDILQGARIQPLKAVLIERVAFLNTIIGIIEYHSESLSFSLFLKEKRGMEKKRKTQNDSL